LKNPARDGEEFSRIDGRNEKWKPEKQGEAKTRAGFFGRLGVGVVVDDECGARDTRGDQN
jgi:hypothetical protein